MYLQYAQPLTWTIQCKQTCSNQILDVFVGFNIFFFLPHLNLQNYLGDENVNYSRFDSLNMILL